MNTVDLSKYSIGDYNPGNRLKRILWYLVNIIFYKTSISYPVKSKVTLLRAFGAKIGKNVVIKSGSIIGSDGFGYEKNEMEIYEKFPHFCSVIIEDNLQH